MSLTAEDLAYRARALAQAHPLTSTAKRLIERDVQAERDSQPFAEFSIWACAAFLHGYCVRRVEEADAGVRPGLDRASTSPELDQLDLAAARVAQELRVGDPSPFLLGEHDRIFIALDRIIASEVERRLDHWRDSVDEEAWHELEGYLTWWVVKGYATRVAEMARQARTPP